MKQKRKCVHLLASLLISISIGFSSGTAVAATVLQMNLAQLCERAEKIFSGTVINIKPGTVAAGGGLIPVLHYRVQISESFKGDFKAEKGKTFAEFTMVGTLKTHTAQQTFMPKLQQGKNYLLMLADAGPVGITSTVGLVQGSFEFQHDKDSLIVNGVGNRGLFNGLNIASTKQQGTISYRELANKIHQGLAEGF
ncbi:MAG: hypothetical protein JKY66_11010 [Spongiibacteraceae bacterium]|nr:hypothetical protein [Spongiibacteraceae bacterium]